MKKAYYFIFENEYMTDIVNNLCEIYNISREDCKIIFKDDLEQAYLLDVKENGLCCVLANKSSYVYSIYILTNDKYKSKIEKLLYELCDDIEEAYGEDRRSFTKPISFDDEVMVDLKNSAKKFGFDAMISKFISIIYELDEIISNTDYKYKDEYNDAFLNETFNYCCFLNECETEIKELLGISLDRVLYSRYYWCKIFNSHYNMLYGKNAGIEQYRYKVFEDINHRINDIDWNLIKLIDEE